MKKSSLLLVVVALSACASQSTHITVAGRVVDERSRPVRSGVVRAYWSHPLSSGASGAGEIDRVIFGQHFLDAKGRFSFTAPSKPDRFEAELVTAAQGKVGELKVVSLMDNVILVR